MHQRRFRYVVESGFELRVTLFSHGWIELAPLAWDEKEEVFTNVVESRGQALDVSLRQTASGLSATVCSKRPLPTSQVDEVRDFVPRMLRLDEDLSEFWGMCSTTPRMSWVARRRAGRILRCPTVFEDLLKLLFTTNCSWSATKLMTSRLVDALGKEAPSGRRAFPSAAVCAKQGESFYRDVVRTGYRAKSCIELARLFADGEIDEEWFTDRSLPLDVVRERLLALPGFGPYAAGQAMRTLGHYKDLALDSWCRNKLAEMAGRKKPPSDKAVARRYAEFDPFDGLALWMDLSADWHASR